MSESHRIQRRRTKGWRMPPGAVYIGRPSRFANPFRPGDTVQIVHLPGSPPTVAPTTRAHGTFTEFDPWVGHDLTTHVRKVANPEDAATLYTCWLHWRRDIQLQARRRLTGRILACWCPPESACHADALLAVAVGREPWKNLRSPESIAPITTAITPLTQGDDTQ